MGNHLASNIIRDLPTNLLRTLKRKTRRFNALPRAEKQFEKTQEKPTRAPIHEATLKQVEQLIKEHPEKLTELTEKDESLHKNLENVFVKSTGENKEIFSKEKLSYSYGYHVMRVREPEQIVPEGRYNSTRAEHFLAAHERDPKTYSSEVLADVYKVNTEAMSNILEYVKVYSVALPVKKTKGPGPMMEMAQDLMPGGLYKEPEFRVLERKVQLAKDRMAKLYGQSFEKRDKLIYDMKFFESLVAIKPMVKKLKEETMEHFTGAKNVEELEQMVSSKLLFKPESKDDAADVPKNVKEDRFLGKAKEKLIKMGVLESYEEIKEQEEADKLRVELKKKYINPYESIAEHQHTSSPQMEEEHHFAQHTKRQLRDTLLLESEKKNLLLEGEKKNDEKNDVEPESSSDSTEVKDAQPDDSKMQHKEKMSDKG